MSGSAWALVIPLAAAALVLGAIVGALVISARRGRAAGHLAEHTGRRRLRRGRGGDHR